VDWTNKDSSGGPPARKLERAADNFPQGQHQAGPLGWMSKEDRVAASRAHFPTQCPKRAFRIGFRVKKRTSQHRHSERSLLVGARQAFVWLNGVILSSGKAPTVGAAGYLFHFRAGTDCRSITKTGDAGNQLRPGTGRDSVQKHTESGVNRTSSYPGRPVSTRHRNYSGGDQVFLSRAICLRNISAKAKAADGISENPRDLAVAPGQSTGIGHAIIPSMIAASAR